MTPDQLLQLVLTGSPGAVAVGFLLTLLFAQQRGYFSPRSTVDAKDALIDNLSTQISKAEGRELARTAERDAALKQVTEAVMLSQSVIAAVDKLVASVRETTISRRRESR